MTAASPILILPFAMLLAIMALGPALAPRWWEKHHPKIALGLGAVTMGIYLLVLHDAASLAHTAHEYLSFVALVGSLFVVSGGIHIGVKGEATPFAKVIYLLIGAVIANVLGTTGAAMLLIRPWIRMNKYRIAAHHIMFFIFIVGNVGGCMTPIGDPPLFLGYLQGVPFWWVAKHCWPMWTVATGALLGIFYVTDKLHFAGASQVGRVEKIRHGGWKLEGGMNLIFLAVIICAVFVEQPVCLREGLMLAAAAGSYFTTKKSVHVANRFNFHPATEVAVLYAGVFATMIPALAWLNGHASTLLGHEPSPGIFYFGTGTLSTVLDNAPTYLGFLSALAGVVGTADMHRLLASYATHIIAISVGAVFFGAATYIGNGPNFMIKTIAEQNGVRMPGFIGYFCKYSLPILLPVLVLVWFLFFRR